MSFWHPHQSSRQTPLTSRHRHFLATACGLGLLFPGHGILASAVQAGGKIPASSSTKLTPENSTPASATGSTPAAKPAPKAGDAGQPAAVDVQVRSKEILEHLNAVIQFFRLSTRPAVQTVGEPSDALYREQAVNQTAQVANLAFQYARAEAALLATQAQKGGGTGATASEGEQGKLEATRARVDQRLADLQVQAKATDAAIAKARAKDLPALRQQKDQLEGAIDLSKAMDDALKKIVGISDSQAGAGLAGDIERLQRSAPELADTKTRAVSPALASLDTERSSGVSSQAVVLFQLLGTRGDIDHWIHDNDELHQQAMDLRTPLTTILRSTFARGQALSQLAATGSTAVSSAAASPQAAAAPPVSAGTPLNFDEVTKTFKGISAASVPLSQEIITLEGSRANLTAWRAAVDTEYTTVLRHLLLRILVIAIALGVLFAVGEIWRRATTRYVHELRRRRQLQVMRRMVIGFLSGIVILFGFVTQFNSLATFAGFITAGLAVGLQTILLSVAAYFFIIGRYGVRVGDRITVAGVTGDVIDVGLVRFYMQELAGTGTELQPTGRVAVFSNAVLFQAGTPLYKQMPGTEYAWHELTARLEMKGDFRSAADQMLKVVNDQYEQYRPKIERQHQQVEAWMESRIDSPKVASRLQMVDTGLQLWVRFPVEIDQAAETDERITQAVLGLMGSHAAVKETLPALPVIRAAVKG